MDFAVLGVQEDALIGGVPCDLAPSCLVASLLLGESWSFHQNMLKIRRYLTIEDSSKKLAMPVRVLIRCETHGKFWPIHGTLRFDKI